MTDPLAEGAAAQLAATLAIDALTVRTIGLLKDIGIDALLLKGPVLGRWLYPDVPRRYDDCDLLVAPASADAARALLRETGYSRDMPPAPRDDVAAPVSEAWTKGWEHVDLHTSYWGLTAAPEIVWQHLWAHRVAFPLERGEVMVPDEPARLLILVLHAAHHRISEPKPREDLRRAVATASAGAWAEAVALGRTLGAGDLFAGVLPAVEGGEALAARLGLTAAADFRSAVAAADLPVTEGLERLLQAPGLRGKARVAAAELLPDRDFMRFHYPVAARGPAGMLAARLLRIGRLTVTSARYAAAARRARGGGAGARNR